MNLLRFVTQLTHDDVKIIWFWMNRRSRFGSGFHLRIGLKQNLTVFDVAFYDLEKVLDAAKDYYQIWGPKLSSCTYDTYTKLLDFKQRVDDEQKSNGAVT